MRTLTRADCEAVKAAARRDMPISAGECGHSDAALDAAFASAGIAGVLVELARQLGPKRFAESAGLPEADVRWGLESLGGDYQHTGHRQRFQSALTPAPEPPPAATSSSTERSNPVSTSIQGIDPAGSFGERVNDRLRTGKAATFNEAVAALATEDPSAYKEARAAGFGIVAVEPTGRTQITLVPNAAADKLRELVEERVRQGRAKSFGEAVGQIEREQPALFEAYRDAATRRR